MLSKARQNVRRPVVAVCAALAAATVVAAAAPARAAEPETEQWMAAVSGSLKREVRVVAGVPAAIRAEKAAIVGAHFDADGMLRAVSLDRPTGNALLDAEALRAVDRTPFPRLPASLRGQRRMIPVEVFFAPADAGRGRPAVRRDALSLAAGARQFYDQGNSDRSPR